MGKTATGFDPALYDYILKSSLREPEVLTRLRRETVEMPRAVMQVAPDQGQFLRLLVEMLGARRVVEIGTFTGYSSLSMALALPADGRLIACDISEEFTRVARRYWQEAGVDDRVELRLGPAAETLEVLRQDPALGPGSLDLAFIDADKGNYQVYFDLCLALLRPGGVIAIDNVLWDGAVLDETINGGDTAAIRAFNANLKRDNRVSISMLPIADGLTLAVKR